MTNKEPDLLAAFRVSENNDLLAQFRNTYKKPDDLLAAFRSNKKPDKTFKPHVKGYEPFTR